MRYGIFTLVVLACASIPMASNVVDASGSVDTNIVVHNPTSSGSPIGVYSGVTGSPDWARGVVSEAVGSEYGTGVEISASGYYQAYGISAPSITAPSGQAYGAALSANGYYTGYGVFASGQSDYYGVGVRGAGSAEWGDGIGVYGEGYSNSSYGIGVYGYGSHYAGVFDGDLLVSSSVCVPCSPSDEMFKKNVRPLSGGLSTVLALKPKMYEMKTEEFKDRIELSEGLQRGFIAQELATVVPEMVQEVTWPARYTEEERKKGVKKEGLKYKAVNYTALIPVLVQAVQEQQAIIKGLEAKIAKLEER